MKNLTKVNASQNASQIAMQLFLQTGKIGYYLLAKKLDNQKED